MIECVSEGLDEDDLQDHLLRVEKEVIATIPLFHYILAVFIRSYFACLDVNANCSIVSPICSP
jgi:hypothetical protein